MKKYTFLIFFIVAVNFRMNGQQFLLHSPDSLVTVFLFVEDKVSYSINYEGNSLLLPSEIGLFPEGQTLDGNGDAFIDTIRYISKNDLIYPAVPEKRSTVHDHYNQLEISLKNGFGLVFRAYNDGVAYRFVFNRQDPLVIIDELAEFNLLPGSTIHYASVAKRPDADMFHTSFEEPYVASNAADFPDSALAFSPVLVETPGLPKMVITESDIFNYPGMFLSKGSGNTLKGRFAPYPLEEKEFGSGFRQKYVTKRADYIATTKGIRNFPWRVVLIAPTDKGLLENDLVFRLASPPSFDGSDWIRPGLSTEEWITGLNLYGVEFRAGYNTATYKYYIDFAKEYGFEYVMLDAGWSDVNDLTSITPGMDMEEITTYARDNGIGLILWTQALTFEKQYKEALAMFKKWGIKIIMTDFIDRDDQVAIEFYQWFAGICAENEFMCMIHGAPKPAGFSRTFPNALAREGVLGSEYNIWSSKANPEHDLQLPFIRMTAGPMDYEPGLLQHATREQDSKLGFEKVIAQGTRMHQFAMFVVYESPLQLFSGNLSDAVQEPKLMRFLGSLPTTWDDTKVIEAAFSDHVVIARRKGDDWYLAAMNDWDAKTFHIPLAFLGDGKYDTQIFRDGINADRNPSDYQIESRSVTHTDMLDIHLAPGGGFLAHFRSRNP